MNLHRLLKMETLRKIYLVESLYYSEIPLSSKQLINHSNCSLPALLRDIDFLNTSQIPLKIVKQKGQYHLQFEPNAAIDILYAFFLNQSFEFKLIELLFFEQTSGIQDSADRLNYSFSNLQQQLKKMERFFQPFHLHIRRRPLQIVGNELMLRRFYFLFFKEKRFSFQAYGFSDELLQAVDTFIQEIFTKNSIPKNTTTSLQLIRSFLIALCRIQRGHSCTALAHKNCGLQLPQGKNYQTLAALLQKELGIVLEKNLSDCLWPLFANHLILDATQLANQCAQDKKLAAFCSAQRELLSEISCLLSNPLEPAEVEEVLRFLINDFYCYYPDSECISILAQPKKHTVSLLRKHHTHALNKLTEKIEHFLQRKRHVVTTKLVTSYLFNLIAAIPNLLERVVAAEKPLNVLLLSEMSPHQEKLWADLFTTTIKGAAKYTYFASLKITPERFAQSTKQYDLLITDITFSKLKAHCPLIAINSYPTPYELRKLQHFFDCQAKTAENR